MSRYDYPDPGSDPAYCGDRTASVGREEQRRACALCGGDVWIGRREPYQLTVWCDRCLAEARNRRMR